MDWNEMMYPLGGGALIGLAVTLMLFFNGRVTGISGIISGGLKLSIGARDLLWRASFVLGLVLGGWLLNTMNPGFFVNTSGRSLGWITVAGLLVGFGTVMGGGCTSGHGICGMSRLSGRSILATAVFMLFGFLSVAAFRFLVGGGQ